MKYQPVIGLEVHIQLKTRTKMFTRAPAAYGFPPNTLADPVVLALPGALPVLNKTALDQVIRAGLMLGCEIAPECRWDRKNYFYPDSPKNYQLTQQAMPICLGGEVEIELPGPARNIQGEHKKIPIDHIHLEEDVGKLNHHATDSLVDFNRAGTPLMELVTKPALHSPDEAHAFLTSLRALMQQAAVSDCDMEKGQMRCDVNVSIRPTGTQTLGTKVEMKNLNSIAYVRDAIAHEIRRQTALLENGGKVTQETRDYDGTTGASQSLRGKEDAHDYRYFPDPDLLPVRVDAEWKQRIAASLPERPFDRQRRLQETYNIPYTLTSVLIWDKQVADYYDCCLRQAAADAPKLAQPLANWIVNDLLRALSEPTEISNLKSEIPSAPSDPSVPSVSNPSDLPLQTRITPENLVALVRLIADGQLTNASAKTVFAQMAATGDAPDALATRLNLKTAPADATELETWCRAAIDGNPKAAAEFRAGKDSAINALKGPVMKSARGKIPPAQVDQALRKLLAGS
ncbi:MAG: Asp-tRNA(Asn)/Glu-tRNA(Gln) amidotransferase subunit GatB [Opitutaceae bacterium]|jgi:aspartyl-tRNA(Asn)/glutamyl-tRNA(Gln) amidotransferase subunit B|nr:Asp-tRNA(Asn)/Glu-tRNA(Gln) amidotransferase subunit GatB [Opitutaceae bacterium]